MRVLSLIANPCVADGRVIKAAEAFADAGHQVTVLALQAPGVAVDQTLAGVRYLRVPYDRDQFMPLRWLKRVLPVRSWLYRGLRMVLHNLLRYGWFERQVLVSGLAARPQLIHAHDLETVPAALRLAAATGARVLYDAHELETDRNPPPLAPVRWRIAQVMRRCLPQVDQVVTVGQGIAERLMARYGLGEVACVYNVPRVRPCARSLRQDAGLGADQALAIYTGKVTAGRGLALILDALQRAPAWHLAIVGPCDPDWRGRLQTWIRERGLSGRVHLLEPVHFDEVASYAAEADLGLLSVEAVTDSYRWSMPNKLFEMALAGLPILCNSSLPEAVDLLNRYGLGQAVDFHDAAALASALERGPAALRTGRRQAEFEQTWGWPQQAAQLLAAADRAMAPRGSK